MQIKLSESYAEKYERGSYSVGISMGTLNGAQNIGIKCLASRNT